MIKIIKLRCLGEERGLSRGEEGAAHTGASQPCTGQHKGTVVRLSTNNKEVQAASS